MHPDPASPVHIVPAVARFSGALFTVACPLGEQSAPTISDALIALQRDVDRYAPEWGPPLTVQIAEVVDAA